MRPCLTEKDEKDLSYFYTLWIETGSPEAWRETHMTKEIYKAQETHETYKIHKTPSPRLYKQEIIAREKNLLWSCLKIVQGAAGMQILWVIILSGVGLLVTQLPLTQWCSRKSPQHTCWFTKLVLCRIHSLVCQCLILGGLMFLHVLLGSHMLETWIWASPTNMILLKPKQ